jgi:hypothetical protein
LLHPFLRKRLTQWYLTCQMGSPQDHGSNTEFMKKCWLVIYQEFYNMYSGFFDNGICLQSINDSYITLVPKVQNPTTINDFWPISLLNSSIMLITRMLVNCQCFLHRQDIGWSRSRVPVLRWSCELRRTIKHTCLSWFRPFL